MLKANVGVSRRGSHDDGGRGFSLELEGEILATVDDPEAVIARILELYGIAEEALDRQISQDQEIEAFARRDRDPSPQDHQSSGGSGHEGRPREGSGSDGRPNPEEPATEKQLAFLRTLAKRNKLGGPELAASIERIVGRPCSPPELSKKEAGRLIDGLNGETADRPPRR